MVIIFSKSCRQEWDRMGIYPPVMRHSKGTPPICRWCSQLAPYGNDPWEAPHFPWIVWSQAEDPVTELELLPKAQQGMWLFKTFHIQNTGMTSENRCPLWMSIPFNNDWIWSIPRFYQQHITIGQLWGWSSEEQDLTRKHQDFNWRIGEFTSKKRGP